MRLDELVQDFVERNGLSLRTTHYKTHASEIEVRFLAEAMRQWEQMGGPEGDTEIPVRGFKGMTRLWGRKMGDNIPSDEPLYTRKRGEGRPFQDRFILRDRPLRPSNIITIVIYDGGLETIYAGNALGPMPDAGKRNGDWANWKDHYLAFTQKELDEMEKMPGKLASRHEVSEDLIERSLHIQDQIDQAESCIEAMDIKGLFDLGMIDRRVYQNWQRAEQNEQDLVDTHGRDYYDPSFQHYYRAMEKADKNIKRLKKEVDVLIAKSRSVLRQATKISETERQARIPKPGNPKYETVPCKSEKAKGPCKAPTGKNWTKKEVTEYYEEVKDSLGSEWKKYEGAMGPNGINQSRVQKNMGKSNSGLSALDKLGPAKKKPSGGGLDALSRLANRVASQYMSKTAASGNYGFTKRVQNDVDVALRKLQKKVDQLARTVENKHPEAGSYFGLRCKGSNCNASKALSNACLLNQPPKRLGNGPLGFKPSCARSAHKAITDLTLYCGEVAHSLYNKDRDHTEYLKTHAKKKRCPLTRMILENYPVELL